MTAPHTGFPDLHEIPAAGSSRAGMRRSLSVPMPDFILRLFASFPLHVWDSAKAAEDAPADVATRPVLYVAPASEPESWASADPVCLRWQMELLWRGADFECRAIDGRSWGPDGGLPFLHLPPSAQTPKRGGAPLTTLLSAQEMPAFVDTHYPLVRLETASTEEDKSVWPDDATALESGAWKSLIEGRITAGALLASITAAALATPSAAREPLLRRALHILLPVDPTPEAIALEKTIELSSAGATSASLDEVFGLQHIGDVRNPLSRYPGFTVDFVGWLNGTASQDAPDYGGEPLAPAPGTTIDRAGIYEQAQESLLAMAARLEQSGANSSGWLLGAR